MTLLIFDKLTEIARSYEPDRWKFISEFGDEEWVYQIRPLSCMKMLKRTQYSVRNGGRDAHLHTTYFVADPGDDGLVWVLGKSKEWSPHSFGYFEGAVRVILKGL